MTLWSVSFSLILIIMLIGSFFWLWRSCDQKIRSLANHTKLLVMLRNSHPGIFLETVFLKICSKFTGEHSCRSVISIKLQSTFIEITLCYGGSPVNLPHIFRTPFTKNTCTWLLLNVTSSNRFLISPPNLISLTLFQTRKCQADFKHFFVLSNIFFSWSFR